MLGPCTADPVLGTASTTACHVISIKFVGATAIAFDRPPTTHAMKNGDLAEPLVAPPKPSSSSSPAGLLMVTAAALLFGVVAAFVKATDMPTLVMLEVRSILEWFLGVGVAVLYLYTGGDVAPLPQPEASLKGLEGTPSGDSSRVLATLLIGPPNLWGWLLLRAFLYWGFLACWWLALASMPIGDATTIVYTGPVWTAIFANLLLDERIDWSFYPIVTLDAIGLALITQPSFLFPRASGTSNDGSYLLGALSSLFSAVIAGLIPVCTRKSKECSWTAVNHTSSALAALVFTPAAFLIWFALDNTAVDQAVASLGTLDGSTDGGLVKWPLLLGATLTGFAGLALQTLGYQREEAARASVMTILEIPFAYLLQSAVFHDDVTPLGLVGVGLVACGTMLNLLRHLQRARCRPSDPLDKA